MFRDKRFQEIAGIVLILAGIILFLALVTYRVTDYRLLSVSSPVSNIIGPLGAFISHALRSAFGNSAYLIAVIFSLMGWSTLRRGQLRSGT